MNKNEIQRCSVMTKKKIHSLYVYKQIMLINGEFARRLRELEVHILSHLMKISLCIARVLCLESTYD